MFVLTTMYTKVKMIAAKLVLTLEVCELIGVVTTAQS